MTEKATEKQVELMKKLKINPEYVITKQAASELIDKKLTERDKPGAPEEFKPEPAEVIQPGWIISQEGKQLNIKTLEYTKKFNLGNYETQDIKVLVEIEENENVDEVFLKLKKKVLEMGDMKVLDGKFVMEGADGNSNK